MCAGPGIKSDLGVAVAVPGSSEQIAQTLFEGALFREMARGSENQKVFDFGDREAEQVEAFHAEWDNARQREKASRSRFAQHSLDRDTVAAELQSVREAIGRSDDVQRFVLSVLQAANVPLQEDDTALTVHLSHETPRALRQAIGRDEPFTGRFE
ncbi:MAG: ATP-dependent helicase, partial [Planctomyces sp.]